MIEHGGDIEVRCSANGECVDLLGWDDAGHVSSLLECNVGDGERPLTTPDQIARRREPDPRRDIEDTSWARRGLRRTRTGCQVWCPVCRRGPVVADMARFAAVLAGLATAGIAPIDHDTLAYCYRRGRV